MNRFLPLLSALLLIGTPLPARAQNGPSLVVLVRHAEKASQTDPDPSLSDAGKARADALVLALANSSPGAIIVSSRKRTAETAEPVAHKFGIVPQVVTLDGAAPLHIAAVAAAVRKQRGVVLVVGHSNTIPAIIKALGGPTLSDICDASYATLYVLQLPVKKQTAHLVTAQYGASDPAGASTCVARVPR